jgi:5-hydroxyisourate hydrolase-like protein (transthyretin family)
MSFIKRVLIAILYLLVLSTCTKFGKNITVQGRVLNPITGEGIAGVEVWLQKTTMGLPGGKKTIKSVTTDADGNFELDKLTVIFPQASGEYLIVDMNGRIMKREFVAINNQTSYFTLPKGLYILKWVNSEEIITKKISVL